MPLAPSYPAAASMLAADTFNGHVALITEPGDSVGCAIAAELARSGAVVVLADRDAAACQAAAAAVEAVGGKTKVVTGDLTDAVAVKAIFDEAEGALGAVTILVNHICARPDLPVELMALDRWRAVTHGMLDTVFNCTRELGARRIADGKGGSVVNFGTPNIDTGGAGRADMTAAQSAVMNLTKSLAVEWAPYNIRVNCIAPGFVAGAEAGPVAESDLAVTVPAGRLCEPHEVAWVAAYMCSPFAAYLSGAIMSIDGASWERPGRSPNAFQPIRTRYDAAAASNHGPK